MSANILAIANQKGGVGKTTTTVNLAASLASRGKRVLVVDLDPQGNATTGSGIDKAGLQSGVYQVLLGDADVQSAAVRSKEGGYGVLGANRALAGAEIELVQEIAREVRLKNALKAVAEDYDFILIDCPPSLTLLTLNGLVAAGGVIVPMLCEYYALEGISDLIATVRKIRQAVNPDWTSRASCVRCTTAAAGWLPKSANSCAAISGICFLKPSSRAISALRKRRATVCR